MNVIHVGVYLPPFPTNAFHSFIGDRGFSILPLT